MTARTIADGGYSQTDPLLAPKCQQQSPSKWKRFVGQADGASVAGASELAGTVGIGDDGDIVQFLAPVNICTEGDLLSLDLIRIGSEEGEVTVSYHTEDGTAYAGEHFWEKSGTVTIPDGENKATIQIQMTEGDVWNPTTEFKVILSDPVGCVLDAAMRQTVVRRIDYTHFPSDAVQEYIKKDIDSIQFMNGWSLFFSWLYLVANIEGNFRKMCIVVLTGLIENVNLYVFTKVQVFLVDKVMNPESNEDDIPFCMNRRNGAIFVCGILATCTAVLHAVKFANVKVGLEGNLLTFIRANTFVKYLDFTAASREKIPPSRLVLIINEDCVDACKGVSGFLKIIQRLSRIGLLILFAVRNDRDSWWIATLILVLAVLMALIRAPVKAPLEDQVEDRQAELVDYIIDSMENYDLIVSSGGRQAVNDGLRARLKSYQSATSPIKRFNLNNAMMIEWGKFAFLTIYIMSVLPAVLSKELTTGKFVAMVSVIRLLCSSCESLVDDLFECTVSFTPLKAMVKCLNLATEVPTLQKEARHRHKLMFQDGPTAGEVSLSPRSQLNHRRSISMQAGEEGTSGFDLLGINMDDVAFSYPIAGGSQSTQLLHRVNLAVDQGSIVCIHSDDATSKRTLLQLLSQFRFPTSGNIFFPPHLRILYVMARPLFFRDTLWKNLIFGCTRTPKPQRVMDIVRKLKMPQAEVTLRQELKHMHTEGKLELQPDSSLLRRLEQMQDVEQLDDKNDIARLPGTELAKLNLCRGFISNPEVLIAHRPAATFDTLDTKELIYNLFKEHRDKRGLAMDDSRLQVHKRRPRTVFYTSQSKAGRDVADVSWVIHSAHNDGKAPFTVKQEMMRHA